MSVNTLEPFGPDEVVALIGIADGTNSIAVYIDTLSMRLHRLSGDQLPVAVLDGDQLTEFRKIINDVLLDLKVAYRDLAQVAVAIGARLPN